jgi:hypothetical protein
VCVGWEGGGGDCICVRKEGRGRSPLLFIVACGTGQTRSVGVLGGRGGGLLQC